MEVVVVAYYGTLTGLAPRGDEHHKRSYVDLEHASLKLVF